MKAYSVLDLSSVNEGQETGEALRQSLLLAQTAEASGYHRFWMAEHHNMLGIASAATSVALSFIGSGTKTIRIGSGGVMLPNHAPYVIAEQFGTLASLYPNRVDLGIGRAPGTDMHTARALRREMGNQAVEQFPQDVQEVMYFLDDAEPNQAILATPGVGTKVPVWLLGSSLYSAQLAAYLGLPYAFASHFAPEMLFDALRIYRDQFKPSQYLDKPYAMACVNMVVADTDEEAQHLFTSHHLSMARLFRNERGRLPAPVDNLLDHMSAAEQMNVDRKLRYSFMGTEQTTAYQVEAFLQKTEVDELMVQSRIFDLEARLYSAEKAGQVLKTFIKE